MAGLNTTPALHSGGEKNSPRCILPNQIRGTGQASSISICVRILEQDANHAPRHTGVLETFVPHVTNAFL